MPIRNNEDPFISSISIGLLWQFPNDQQIRKPNKGIITRHGKSLGMRFATWGAELRTGFNRALERMSFSLSCIRPACSLTHEEQRGELQSEIGREHKRHPPGQETVTSCCSLDFTDYGQFCSFLFFMFITYLSLYMQPSSTTTWAESRSKQRRA